MSASGQLRTSVRIGYAELIAIQLAAHADRLRALHHASEPLVLPNVWDAASARAVVEAGFPVVATSSHAVADSLGWADGQRTPTDEMFSAVARIARVVEVPVTADLEGGYGLSAEEFVARMLAAGVVGCNLEDTDHSSSGVLLDPVRHADYLAAVKAAGRAAGVDIVLNARVDVFLRQVGEPAERARLAIERARHYVQAGVDCVFPFGIREEADIQAMLRALDCPLNVIALPGVPPTARLRELGVARISFGGRLHRAAQSELQRQLQSIRSGGTV
jgi:2-methylisocitrate lyase-like PEP mutase family enzyme